MSLRARLLGGLVAVLAVSSFSVNVSLAAGPTGPAHVRLGKTPLGEVLVGDKGMTLYMFTVDKDGQSACYDQCAAVWPALLTNGAPLAGTGVKQELLGTTVRRDGTTQVTYSGNAIELKPPWRRVTLRDAVLEYSGIDFVAHPNAEMLRDKMRSMNIEADPSQNWAKLVDGLLDNFVKPKLIQPTFLFDYPVSMSPLAKSKPGNERVVERFQPFAAAMQLGNAYSELNDPILQRQRFQDQLKERQGEEEEHWTIDEDFLLALEYGMPPTGGLGIGIDRLVMLLTDQTSIREVILFPQLKEKE